MTTRTLAIGALVIAAIAAAIAIGGPLGLGAGLAIASGARALSGRGWLRTADDAGLSAALGGAVCGALALGGALALSEPIAGATGRGVEWSTLPVVRGSVTQALTLAVLVIAIAAAAELGLRRGLLELVADRLRARGLGPAPAAAAAIACAALVEAAIAPLDGDRLGIALTSAGLGLIYVGAGRRLGASLSARLVFEVGAVALQALRLVG